MVTVRRAGARARRALEDDETRATARYTITARKPPETAANHQKTAVATRKLPESLPLPDRILAVLRQNPSTSRRALAAALGTTQPTVRYHVDKLRTAGWIERVGPDKGGHWKVLDIAHTEAGPSG
ncbi:MAG: winged helix-turn-helix domain-containing protein [Gemmatimonadota bacterium]|nr:winged helix-turn-helix domain-containing protein [Gemmatimonadota bacterium]